jgi:hypothetical protein
MRNLFFILVVLLSAISISGIAAAYSIIGLATLFAGAKVAIIAMGTSLEVGKLVAASWLYQNWKNSNLPKTIRAYLTTSVIVLVFVTSMGIFGFLSKAHLDQVRPTSDNAVHISLIDRQILQEKVYIDKEYVSRGLKERKKQKEERDFLNNEIRVAMDKIAKLTLEKGNIELEQLKIEADVGPLKYVAELIYGDEAKEHFDEAVRWIIIVLIFVFDPLAVLLLIAANISLRERKLANEAKNKKKEKDTNWQREATRAKITAQGLRDKQKFYKTFFTKLGKRSLTNRDYEDFFKGMGTEELMKLGLDPDEIRIKLDQIMEFNEPTTKPYLESGVKK